MQNTTTQGAAMGTRAHAEVYVAIMKLLLLLFFLIITVVLVIYICMYVYVIETFEF